jgi:hypothetical protein
MFAELVWTEDEETFLKDWIAGTWRTPTLLEHDLFVLHRVAFELAFAVVDFLFIQPPGDGSGTAEIVTVHEAQDASAQREDLAITAETPVSQHLTDGFSCGDGAVGIPAFV